MRRPVHTSLKGFSLIELLLVVLVLGLIASIAVPRIAHSGEETKKSVCASNISRMNAAIELWAVTNGGDYPSGTKTAVERALLPIGVYPTDQTELNDQVLNNHDIFPDGPPVCPYGVPYEYDSKTNRIKPHHH